MKITVFYFARLREEMGTDISSMTITEGTTVLDLFKRLFPGMSDGIRFAVNQCYVEGGCLLEEGDEVAFLPPLGGG